MAGLDNSVNWLMLKLEKKASVLSFYTGSTVAQAVSQHRKSCILWHNINYTSNHFIVRFYNLLPLTDHPEQPKMNPTRKRTNCFIIWVYYDCSIGWSDEATWSQTWLTHQVWSNQKHWSESHEWGSGFIQTDLFYRCATTWVKFKVDFFFYLHRGHSYHLTISLYVYLWGQIWVAA